RADGSGAVARSGIRRESLDRRAPRIDRGESPGIDVTPDLPRSSDDAERKPVGARNVDVGAREPARERRRGGEKRDRQPDDGERDAEARGAAEARELRGGERDREQLEGRRRHEQTRHGRGDRVDPDLQDDRQREDEDRAVPAQKTYGDGAAEEAL